MEDLLMRLTRAVRIERAVARQSLRNGMELLVYPLDDGVVIGLGVPPDRMIVGVEEVLSRRSRHLERYGAWLPVRLADGKFYVCRRVIGADGHATVLSDQEMIVAEELLS